MDATLVVMAAGMGSRYGGLKQMDPVGPAGETLLDYSVFDAVRSGFDSLVFVIRREFETEFRQRISSRFEDVLPVRFAFQDLHDLPGGFQAPADRVKPWGTGHAVLAARDVVETPFCVINADDFYGRGAFKTMVPFLKEQAAPDLHALVAYRLRNTLSEHGTVSRGICVTDADACLLSAREVTAIARTEAGIVAESDPELALTGDELVSMNFWGFHPSLFASLEAQFAEFLAARGGEMKSEFYIPSAVNALIETGTARCRVLRSDAAWFGITYREDRDAVVESIRAMVEAGEYPAGLSWLKE